MTLQFRTNEATGGICCSSTNGAGERVPPQHPCEKCAAHFAALGLPNADDGYAPPDPYAPHLAAMRRATPLTPFEQRWRGARIEALAAEYADYAAHGDNRFTTLSADDLSQYTPPDPYQLALAARKERR